MLTHEQAELVCRFAERKKSLKAASWAMEWLGVLTFGVDTETVCNESFRYINVGDSYGNTIIRQGGMYSVGTWGDMVEAIQKEYELENDETLCGYCGQFYPNDEPHAHDIDRVVKHLEDLEVSLQEEPEDWND